MTARGMNDGDPELGAGAGVGRSTILSAALTYADWGWHVFPAPPGTKKSHKSAEYSDGRAWGATTDPAEIRRDWSQWPEANIGIVTGPKSGFFVVDIDTEEGHGVDGGAALACWIEEHGPLPNTMEASTPSDGRHLYFRYPEELKIQNSAGKIAPGIDIRGDGGMIMGPPSVKPGQAIIAGPASPALPNWRIAHLGSSTRLSRSRSPRSRNRLRRRQPRARIGGPTLPFRGNWKRSSQLAKVSETRP